MEWKKFPPGWYIRNDMLEGWVGKISEGYGWTVWISGTMGDIDGGIEPTLEEAKRKVEEIFGLVD